MSNHEVCDKVTEDDYRMPMPKGCPPEIYAIMRKCWQQEPEDRVTFDELVKDITAIMPNLAGGGVALAKKPEPARASLAGDASACTTPVGRMLS